MHANSDSSQQGSMLGRYRLLRLLGRGGMGEVWLAEDTQLRRQVAVKLLPSILATDSTYRQVFEREARAAAALEHPNILPIHDFGEQPNAEDKIITYLVMPHVSGGSLRDRIRNAQNGILPTGEALHYLQQAAQAIDFAHNQQVLHRDIKPANMLLQQDWLFLADFGIAKLLTSTTQRSQTHTGSGTPEYMAPEQAQGKAEPASDRYSLAVTAYQIFTGRLPFRGETPYSILVKQVQEAPPAPRQFNHALPSTLEQALLWGLAKRPEDRPSSCVALVSALGSDWQISPQALADPEATVLAPWSKRKQENPQIFKQEIPSTGYPAPGRQFAIPYLSQHIQGGTGGALSYIPPLPTVLQSTNHYNTQNTPPYLATPPQTPASTKDMGFRFPRRALLIGGGAAAIAAIGGAGLYTYSRLAPGRNPPIAHPRAVPGPQKLIKGVPLLSLRGHNAPVKVAAWDPTGRYLATGSDDTYVMLWDIGGSLQKKATSVQSISTPLHNWKVSNNQDYAAEQDTLCWSADGRTLAVITTVGNQILLYGAFNGSSAPHIYQDINKANAPIAPVYDHLAWSPKSNMFATHDLSLGASQATQIGLWQSGHPDGPVRILSYNRKNPSALSEGVDVIGWSADGTMIAGHTDYGLVIIWQAATGTIKQVLTLPDRPSPKTNNGLINNESIPWSPVDPHLLAASSIDLATIWDVQQNKKLLTLELNEPLLAAGTFYVWSIAWSPNGKYVAMCYPRDPRVYIWDALTSGPGAALGTTRTQTLFFPDLHTYGHTRSIYTAVWSPDGRYIATASADKTAIVWRVDGS